MEARLQQSIAAGDFSSVRKELSEGADIAFINRFGNTLMHEALSCAEQHRPLMTELLFDAGYWSVDVKNSFGYTALHIAVLTNAPDSAAELVGCGSPLTTPDSTGTTPLHVACGFKSYEKIVSVLVRAGANVHALNTDGRTPLHLSTRVSTTMTLIAAGAEIAIHDKRGDTPLHLAVGRGDEESVFALLLAKANPSAVNSLSQTPLHRAVAKDRVSRPIIQALITALGGNVLARDYNKCTALQVLCQNNIRCSFRDKMQELLVEAAKQFLASSTISSKIPRGQIE